MEETARSSELVQVSVGVLSEYQVDWDEWEDEVSVLISGTVVSILIV